MELSDYHYIVFLSIKNKDGKIIDQPLFPCLYENDAKNYITGYVHAIINHTSETNEAKIRGQFSIRDVAGDIVDKNEGASSANKETENV